MRYVLLIFAIALASCASNDKPKPKTMMPQLNGTTCKSGNANICYKQGIKYHVGKKVSPNDKKAIYYYERACQLGHVKGCYRAASRYQYAKDKTLQDHSRARRLYQKACKNAYKAGCHRLAMFMTYSPKNNQDFLNGLGRLNTLCDQNYAESCHGLAYYYRTVKGFNNDRKLAKTYYQNACKLKHATSCLELADRYKYKKPDELIQRYTLLDKACRLGNKEGCIYRAFSQVHGHGTKKQEARGFKSIELMCTNNNPKACFHQASLMVEGLGTAKDIKGAQALLLKSCQSGHIESCYLAVHFYRQEEHGVSFDIHALQHLYETGCRQNDNYSCLALANLYMEGRGVKKDPLQADVFYQKACKNNFQFGCLGQGDVQQEHHKNYKKANAIFAPLCKQNVTFACANLAKNQSLGRGIKQDIKKAKGQLQYLCYSKKHNECFDYGKLLMRLGDKPGAIKAFEQQCKKTNKLTAADACVELVKLGQFQYHKRAKTLSQFLCKRLYQDSCEQLKTLPSPPKALTPKTNEQSKEVAK